MNNRPNVLLIVVDQMRRDALGVNGSDDLHTPHLDQLAREGINFSRAYSACPSCIAARAALMTGLRPDRHGFTGYDSRVEWRYPTTLAGTLAAAGYHTQCVGKMHVEPARNLLGFHHVVLHDGFLHDKRQQYRDAIEYDDYLPDIRRHLGPDADIGDCGVGCNGYAVRPWPWDVRYHPTSWVTSRSIEFLKRRDPTRPFFLKVSYHRPHTPLDPPPEFLRLYDAIELPEPIESDWSGFLSTAGNVENPVPSQPPFRDRARKAYHASVSHIDYELNRLFIALGDLRLWDNLLIVFVSDHGDLLYDHRLVRKALPFEGCAGIPLLLRLPPPLQDRSGRTDGRLAELCDIFPTICEVCGIPVPASLDGHSLLDETFRRDSLHGEHCYGEWSNHWLTDGREKYCWFSQSGRELLFDLVGDPQERHDLSAARPERTAFWRHRLVQELAGRPEGYVEAGQLVNGRTPVPSLPWAGKGK